MSGRFNHAPGIKPVRLPSGTVESGLKAVISGGRPGLLAAGLNGVSGNRLAGFVHAVQKATGGHVKKIQSQPRVR